MRVRGPVIFLLACLAATGCRAPAALTLARPPAAVILPSLSPFRHVEQAVQFPREASRDEIRSRMIENVRERLMSHRDIERDAARMVTDIAPIVEAAANQPEAQAGLRRYAADAGLSTAQARRRWIALQTADLMLESGGDPDALSSSAAAGAAQWLAGTAQGVGLPVDVGASNRLTAAITAARCRIAWITYLGRPDADRSAPGAPAYSPADAALLPALNVELQSLRSRRARIDARYDPRRAIFAQTRYLLRLYSRFPSPDWLFQAYHGGEGGVARTLRLYLGPHWPGAADRAIRSGADGAKLTFDTLYFNTTPGAHPEAFSYLYGRSDDHRHYWYKLMAAEQVIDAYRKSPERFRQEWEACLPGRRIEGYWYPEAAADTIVTIDDLKARKDLVRVDDAPGLTVRPAGDDPPNASYYRQLRPEAKGALLLVLGTFRRYGGKGPLETGDLTLTQEYADRARLLHPPKPPRPPLFPPDPDADLCIGGGPPRRFDYHTTGLVFDLLRPHADRDRKILEYALDRLEARGLLSAIEAKDHDTRRFHIVPHPAYADLFRQAARTGSAPAQAML